MLFKRLAIAFISGLFVMSAVAGESKRPHLDLDYSSQEFRSRNLLSRKFVEPEKQLQLLSSTDDPIERALALGERLFQWLEMINASRADKIRLTSPQDRKSTPITAPKRYSPQTVATQTEALLAEMPVEMKSVLFAEKSLTPELPISVENFIRFGQSLDRIYQTASRWKALFPFKSIYIREAAHDIRGYYFLTTNNWDPKTLENWEQIDSETKGQIVEALEGICINAINWKGVCKQNSKKISDGAAAIKFYNQYFMRSQAVYNDFFHITNPRSDISWTENKVDEAIVPFVLPESTSVLAFIRDNIQDEYKFGSWGLKINFVNSDFVGAPYLEFIAGATPHVEFIGGNQIVMDGNKSIDEYEPQWVIRHEFGHVLGLPDCYHEFFDEDKNEFVNYQIDTTDLMCSRAGNMNERIYKQLKQAYMSAQ